MAIGITRLSRLTAVVASFAALPAVVTAALAADMSSNTNAAYDWTGFYIGANAGGGSGNRNVGYSPNDHDSAALFGVDLPGAGGAPPGTPSYRSSGALAGVQAGYNRQFGVNWLVGVESDFQWSGMKGGGSSRSTPFAQDGGSALAVVDERTNWFGTVRARLGYLPAQNFLTYLTGGFAYGEARYTGNYINTSGLELGAFGPGPVGISCLANAPTCATGSSSRIAVGWTAGAGFEYGISQNVSFKAEYIYVNLAGGSVTEIALVPGGPATVPATFNANFNHASFNIGRVGLNYRF